jgi:hypothetical protein
VHSLIVLPVHELPMGWTRSGSEIVELDWIIRQGNEGRSEGGVAYLQVTAFLYGHCV